MEGLGPFMRKRRDELDLSLREFAKRLDCSAAFISDIELGRRHPSEKVLAEIARVLDVNLETLQAMDVRPPIEEIKRLTHDDPRFALAFRTMIDKKVSADELLKLANQKRDQNPKPEK
jgi:transcriptional regulator with XRE-family HTH domain